MANREIKLTFKGFGSLRIGLARNLSFKRMQLGEQEEQEAVTKEETAAQVLDRASAILSTGGKISVKSGFLSSL